MRIGKFLMSSCLIALTSTPWVCNAAFADNHDILALQDLRYARALIKSSNADYVIKDKKNAVKEITATLAEFDHARIDDGKSADDIPEISKKMTSHNKINKAMELLEAANRNLALTEDDKPLPRWHLVAMHRINNAYKWLVRARKIEDADDKNRPKDKDVNKK